MPQLPPENPPGALGTDPVATAALRDRQTHWQAGHAPPVQFRLGCSSLIPAPQPSRNSLFGLHKALPYLTDDQLVEAFTYASSFGKRSWLVQAAILYMRPTSAAFTEIGT
jgi:hypothetical protein